MLWRGGAKFAITCPSECVIIAALNGSTTNNATRAESITISGTLTTNGYNVSNYRGNVIIKGVAVNGANAGTVQLQFASGTNGQTSTILVNSFALGRLIM